MKPQSAPVSDSEKMSTAEREQKIETDAKELQKDGVQAFARREGESGPMFLILSRHQEAFHVEDEFVSRICHMGYETSYVDYKHREIAFKPLSSTSTPAASTSSQSTDYTNELSDQWFELERRGPISRLEGLADIAEHAIEERGIHDPAEIKDFCTEFGARDVVGCGIGAMPMHKVLRHLSEYVEIINSLDAPAFGGSKAVEEQLTMKSSGVGFSHSVYWALQGFYADAIFAIVIIRMEIFDEETVLDTPVSKAISKEVYEG